MSKWSKLSDEGKQTQMAALTALNASKGANGLPDKTKRNLTAQIKPSGVLNDEFREEDRCQPEKRH